jgi:PAS domain S-box-containing protein
MFDPVIDDDIRLLAEAGLLPSKGPVLYLTDQKKLIVQRGIDRAGAETLVGSRLVDRAAAGLSAASGVEVVAGGRALVVGVRAIAPTVGGQRRLLGLVVATVALDDGYLGPRVGNDRNLSLALVDRDRKLAGVGSLLPGATTRVGRDALGPSGRVSSISGGAFLAGRALPSISGTPVLALVASTPTSVVEDTRSSLFRTLFLVALATSLAAFAAALLVGERIGGGLRRLTVAAGRIQRGDFGARVDIATQDEVGVLASTLNSMAGSIQTLTTELRQNRDEEAALRGRLEAVVGGMGEAVVAVDPAGRITTFNRAAQELFGVVVGQALARPIGEVASVATEDGTDLTPRLARPEAARWGEAAVVHRRDGVDVPVALSAGGLPGADGRVGGGVYVLRDMRREREADRAKNDLLANISHELRTPLVPIKGYALMLRRGRLPAAETLDAIERISDAADQLERLIQRLLEVAAGDRRADLRLEQLVVRPVVESVLRRWKARDGGCHRMTQRVARGLSSIRADRASLEEALDELVDNAVKFSPAGSRVQVGALAARTSDGRDAVELFVADQGRGMTGEQANRMFEDFAQADTSATRDVGGLGLGLPIVRSVVAAHAGELSWESEPGRGSRFSMVLPLDPQSDRQR